MLLTDLRPQVRIDVHQHVWTEPLLEALAGRDRVPFVRVTPEGLTVLHSAGERPYVIDVQSETARERSSQLRRDGAKLALVAISSPIGIEVLPHDRARELISAHLDGVLALGDPFRAWGPIAVHEPDPAQVDELLGRGCIGVSVSAGAIADRDGFDALAPVFERAQASGVALFVHPGPGLCHPAVEASLTEPLWWRALTDYVAQMQAAWLTFATYGRRELSRLRVVFAMLAGGAPLLSERLAARGGPEIDLTDPLTFYDTSSYGPKVVEAMARWVGPSQLMYGSDRPVIEPVRTGREVELMANAAVLLETEEALI
jgi:6-methylsalicylate decarboxylase